MRRFFVIVGAASLAIFLVPVAAYAQEFNHTITVYAVVPEQRVIYLDQYGAVIKIAGNTTRNIQPKVYDSSYREVPMSPAVQELYDAFLKQHDYHLIAGKIYAVNPLSVNNTPSSQTISLANPQKLALSIK
jgi:hypothetical protein